MLLPPWSCESFCGGLREKELIRCRMQPIFHEGSKGYSCCKRRTLDFDEFRELLLLHPTPRCF